MMKTEEWRWRLTAPSPFETRFEFEEKDWSFLLLGHRMASWVRSAHLHSHPRLHPHQSLKKRLAIHQQSHIVSLPNSHSHLRGRVFCNFDDETTKKQSQPQPTGIQLYSEIERFSFLYAHFLWILLWLFLCRLYSSTLKFNTCSFFYFQITDRDCKAIPGWLEWFKRLDSSWGIISFSFSFMDHHMDFFSI